MSRVTLQTLADDLGVSRVTISNAFNRPNQLSGELRERILVRAAELGFVGPDPLARGLRRGRTGAIGVLVDQSLSSAFSDPAAVAQFDGLATELSAGGSGLLLHALEGHHMEAGACSSRRRLDRGLSAERRAAGARCSGVEAAARRPRPASA